MLARVVIKLIVPTASIPDRKRPIEEDSRAAANMPPAARAAGGRRSTGSANRFDIVNPEPHGKEIERRGDSGKGRKADFSGGFAGRRHVAAGTGPSSTETSTAGNIASTLAVLHIDRVRRLIG